MFTTRRSDPAADHPTRRPRTRLLVGSACLAGCIGLAGLQPAHASAHGATAPGQRSVRSSQLAAPLAGGGGGGVTNHGGPVQTALRVYLDLWGWTSDPSGVSPYLQSFLSKVGGTAWLSTVNQYGASSAVTLAGVWSHAATVPSVPTDAQIQAEARAVAAHFAISSTDVNVQLVVATPSHHSSAGFGSSYCAYRGVISGSSDPYTNLPYQPDAGATCGAGLVAGPLDGVSIVEGHELADTLTDPLLNGWYSSAGADIGDLCTGAAAVSMHGSFFAVGPLWSNLANACVY